MRSLMAFLTAAALAVAACGGDPGAPPALVSGSDAATPFGGAGDIGAGSGALPSGLEPTEPAGGATDGRLDGTAWTGRSAEPASPADVALVDLAFANGRLSATGGCNRLGGDYRVTDGILRAPALAATEMACVDALMRQDTWLAALLDGSAVTVDGATLTLEKGGTTLVLSRRTGTAPAAPLEGTTWRLVGIAGAGPTSSVPGGVVATLTIGSGEIRVDFGCNSGSGQVSVDGSSLRLGMLASTMVLCEGPPGEVEQAMKGALRGDVPFAIEGSTLTLSGSDGTTLTFTAAG